MERTRYYLLLTVLARRYLRKKKTSDKTRFCFLSTRVDIEKKRFTYYYVSCRSRRVLCDPEGDCVELCPIPRAALKPFYVRRVRDLKQPSVPVYFYFLDWFCRYHINFVCTYKGPCAFLWEIHVTSRGGLPAGCRRSALMELTTFL